MKVDIAGVLTVDQSFPVAVEYDGSYYHHDKVSTRRDIEKTIALLNAGYVVIRVREQTRKDKLLKLPLQHPRLLQLTHVLEHKNPVGPEDLTSLAEEIEVWIRQGKESFVEERHNLTPVVLLEAEGSDDPAPSRTRRKGLGRSGRTAAWMSALDKLAAYVEANESALVPQRYVTDDGFWLGSWVKRQRGKVSELQADQISLLEGMPGWSWLDARPAPDGGDRENPT
ncbi:Helicase associated domain protein [Arthrobacter sp. NPDC092385]|uniref:Helicase associated domain protein n=1 Tax=Arthrobacter sp. NPDC092385 TaxID=3363943 RepID=UPI0038085F03